MARCRATWETVSATLLALGLLPAVAQAQDTRDVDVQLVLAVDVSLSMSPGELEIQRRGYATAMTDKQVVDAMLGGARGRVALAYIEWAGHMTQRVVVPWTVISSPADAERFGALLTRDVPQSARRTSISGGLSFAADLIAESGFRAPRRIIDVSGDGPNNQGAAVEETRDRVVAQGITINGLPLMTGSRFSTVYDINDLDLYYQHCVIGGPGSFMFPVNGWEQFPEAVRRKLVLELAGRTPERPALPVVKVASPAPYDCLVGEKMWGRRPWNLDVP